MRTRKRVKARGAWVVANAQASLKVAVNAKSAVNAPAKAATNDVKGTTKVAAAAMVFGGVRASENIGTAKAMHLSVDAVAEWMEHFPDHVDQEF